MKKSIVAVVAIGTAIAGGSNSSLATEVEHFTLPENRSKNLPFSEAVRVDETVYLAG